MALQAVKKKARKLFDQHKLEEAKTLYQQVCEADRQDMESWLELGTLHGMLNEIEPAINCFRRVTGLAPQSAEAWFNLGRALTLAGQPREAASAYEKAVSLKPDWPQAYNNLANTQQSLGLFNEALKTYQEALKLAPAYAEAWFNRSNVLLHIGRTREALEGFRRALELAPDNLLCHRNYSSALIVADRLDEALAAYRRMAEVFPDNPEPLAEKARLLDLMGDKPAALATLTPLLERFPRDPHVALVAAELNRDPAQSEEQIDHLQQTLQQGQIQQDNKLASNIHFVLGKLYNRAKKYDSAFHHFKQANELIKRPFDCDEYDRYITSIIRQHSRSALAAMPHANITGRRPLFIVGMPRSGTSLTEQILASHPEISGAGELSEIFTITDSISERLDGRPPYPSFMNQLDQALCDEMARRYLDRLDHISEHSLYVSDKMPHNFLYLGLISHLFPEARIIHCRRNPLDTCLSCYFQNFTVGHGYAHDLETLGRYYRLYEKLMRHWREVLDIPLMTLDYESLVDTPEENIRHMLEFLGLEWDDACLEFHKSKRVINTASFNQVREPLYRHSVERWRHYKSHLQPLFDALAE
jgi:tetratricopeptide (TPR) repeat protein